MNNEIEGLGNVDDQDSKKCKQELKMISDYQNGNSSSNPLATESTVELKEKKPEGQGDVGNDEETPLSPISTFNAKVAMATARQENASLPAIAVTDVPIHRTTSKSVSYSSSSDGQTAASVPPKKQAKLATIKAPSTAMNGRTTANVSLKKSELLTDTSSYDYQPSDTTSSSTYVPLNKDALLYELASASTTFSSKSTSTNTPPYSISAQSLFTKPSPGIGNKPGKTSIGQQFNGTTSIPNNVSSALITSSSLSTSSSSSSSSSSPSSTSFLTTTTTATSTEASSASAQTPISSASHETAAPTAAAAAAEIKSSMEKRVKPCHLSILPSPSASSAPSSSLVLSGVIRSNLTEPPSSSSSAASAFASTGPSMTLNQLQSISGPISSQMTFANQPTTAVSTQSAVSLAPTYSPPATLLAVDEETKLKNEQNKELLNFGEVQQQQPMISNEQQQQKATCVSDEYEEKNTRSPPPPSFAWSTSSSSSSSTTSLSKHANDSHSSSSFYKTVGHHQKSQQQQPSTNPFSATSQESSSSNVNFEINDGGLISPSSSSVVGVMKKRNNSHDLGQAVRHKDAGAAAAHHQHDSSASSSSVLSSASTLINQEDTISNHAGITNTGNKVLDDKIDTIFMPRSKYRNRDFDSNLSILMSDDYDHERFGQPKDPCSSSMKSFVDELPQFPSKAPLLGEISSECGSGSSFDGSNDEANQPSITCSSYGGNKLSSTMKFLPPSYLSATAMATTTLLQSNNNSIHDITAQHYQQQVNDINIDDSSSMGDPAILKRASGVIDIQAMDDDSPVTYETSLHSKIDYIEDDKPILVGIKVRAATIPKLIQILVDSFDKNGELIGDTEFPRVFLLMHKWFMESDELFVKLRDLYATCEDSQTEYQSKICHAYHYWIKTFPSHFALDCDLKEKTRELSDLIEARGNKDHLHLIDISNMESYDWVRKFTTRNPAKSKQKISLAFNKIEPEVLANQLTFIEWKTLRRISFNDYKSYAIEGNIHNNLPLERSIQLFNGLSQWIQCMVLKKTTPKQRADIIHKFIEIAKHLRRLQNFNSLMAVVGGICHSAIARLSKTNLHLSEEDQKILGDFMELLSSNYNYSQYRKTTSELQNFWIPIIGIHLKDLISLHTAHLDKLDNELINFRKMAQLSVIFQSVSNLQNSLPPVNENRDLIKLLQLSLDMTYSEDEIYEISLAREPRTSVSSPSTPTRISAFADWAKSISTPPDPAMIQKHVNAMVDAVFKNYDHDRDNFISHSEFNEIAQNFPFIDTFAVLDADKDGMISKNEMKSYFLKANYHALKKEFKHEFHETTYFKPTFCTHCSGLLWGLIKQGWKCKDCGINAHRGCKDQVVIECRPKRILRQPSNSGVGTNESMRKRSSSQRSSMRKQVTYKQKGTQTEQFDDLFLSDESLTSADEGNGGNNNSSNASFNCYDMNDGVYSIETTLTNLSNSGSNTTIAGGKSNDGDASGQILSPHQQRSSNHQHRRRKKSPKRRKSLPSQCSSNEEPHPVTLIPRGPLICSNSESSESWLLPNPYTAAANTALHSAINSLTAVNNNNSSSNTNVAAATAAASIGGSNSYSTNPSSPLTINTSLTPNSPSILTSSPLPMSANILSKPISFTNPIFYDGVDGVETQATLPLSNPVADSKIPSELFSSSIAGTSSSPIRTSTSPVPTTVTLLSKQTSTNNMVNPAASILTSTISSMKHTDKKANETNATSKSTASGATTERSVNNVRFKLQPRDSCYEGTRRVVTTKSISADPTNDYAAPGPSMPKPLNLQQPTPKLTPVKLKRFNDKKPTHPLSPMGSLHGINSSSGSTSVGTSTNSPANSFSYSPLINSSSTLNPSHSSSISASIQSALAKNKIINSIYPRDRIESTDYDNNDDFHDDDQLSSTEEENEVFIKLKLQKAEEERKKLAKENEKIKQQLQTANAQISSLKQEMSCIKKDSVTLVASELSTLHLLDDLITAKDDVNHSESVKGCNSFVNLGSNEGDGTEKAHSSSDA